MRNEASLIRVGLTVLLALAVLAGGILVIGERSFLFTSTDSYYVLFQNVGGLDRGSPVQLNGVVVGRVEDIVLSENVEDTLLRVWVEIESRYTERIRSNSVARIKSLGLLGDKYVEITSGSPGEAPIVAGGQIPAAQPTDVDSLIRSGEDLADYVVSTARSLTAILNRMEKGEGLVGELLQEREGKKITDSLESTLESVNRVARRLDTGNGTFGRLVSDEELANQISESVTRVQRILSQVEEGDGVLGTLINDKESADSMRASLSGLQTAVADLGSVARDLKEKRGVAGRIINDEEYAERLLSRLESVITNLDEISGRIKEGDGSVARFINDPDLYQAINDIVIGVNESKMLRWLVRNRQKAGIERRYKDAQPPSGAAPAEEPGAD